MVFICSKYTLEELASVDIAELDWFLFDSNITSKNLKKRAPLFSGFAKGNLGDYIDRLYYYSIYYSEPLHCYLMKKTDYYKLHLLPEQYENCPCIWNMARVPDDVKDTPKYPKIPREQRRFGNSYENTHKYLHKKFEELINCNLDNGISHIIL